MRALPKRTPLSKHKTVGYLRVPTGEQEREKNKADILQLANQEDLGKMQFVRGKVLEKIAWRKWCIADLLDSLQAKDILVVSELSRLGRSMLECREILSIAAQKDVNVYAVKGAWRLDQSIQSYAWDFSSLCWDLPDYGYCHQITKAHREGTIYYTTH